jgi:hypothetical protein
MFTGQQWRNTVRGIHEDVLEIPEAKRHFYSSVSDQGGENFEENPTSGKKSLNSVFIRTNLI